MTAAPEQVQVTQADRDAAAVVLEVCDRPISAFLVRQGRVDDDPVVQAFARHRHTATADALEAMRDAFERQTENMAFVLNNVTMPDQWYEKLTAELAADRAAIATLEGTIYR